MLPAMTPERFGRSVPPQARRPVPWYAPIGLRQIAQQQLWSTRLLHNLDRRETFTERSAPFRLIDLRSLQGTQPGDPEGFWFDFVADTGDGGSATYAVARGLLAPQLEVQGEAHPLPEGQLLLLGGDLAYPAASPELYQARLVELFELARDGRSRFVDAPPDLKEDTPWQPDHKLLAAIPQNHDWFDSASTFCRYFVNDEKAGLIGARSPQPRSYFALALPHGWYLLGLDFALTGDLDRSQYEAFARLIETGAIPRGAQLLLIYPEPTWTRRFADLRRDAYPLRFQRLEHLCAQHGLEIRLRLAGDLHHYVRDRLPAATPTGGSCDLVTCGSGGAFGHLTHSREVREPKLMQWASEPDAVPEELCGRVLLGRVADAAAAAVQGLDFSTRSEPQVRYPDEAASRRLARGNLLALLRPRGEPWWHSNLTFALLLGALWLLLDAPLATAGAESGAAEHLQRLLTSPTALAAGAGLGFCALMLACDNDPLRADRGDWAWGLGLGLLWIGAALAWGQGLVGGLLALAPALAPALAWPGAGPLAQLWPWAVAAPATVIAASLVAGASLWALASLGHRAVTNSSSALSHQGHKGFLRFCARADRLEVWMLGLNELPQDWVQASPAGGDRRPQWEPAPGQPPLTWRVVDRFDIERPQPSPAPRT
jgi:hypothetical protein